MSRRRKKRTFTAWLLAVLLLWVGAVAAAHELDHALDHHHELCALHHYAGHDGGLPGPALRPAAPPAGRQAAPSDSLRFFSISRPAPYAVRAPPSV